MTRTKKLFKKAKMPELFIGIYLGVWALTSPALAVSVSHLYQGQVPISSQSLQERQQAYPKALEQVIKKVSGNSHIASLPAMSQLLSHSASYVQSFSYETTQPAESGDAKQQLLLNVQFSSVAVNAALKKHGQVVWGNNRPLTVAFVRIDTLPQTQTVLAAGSDNSALQTLQQLAKENGLPLLLPLMDLSDATVISLADFTPLKPAVFVEAGKRYGAEGELIGYVRQTAGQSWSAQWIYVLKDQQFQWETQASDLSALFSKALANLSNDLAARYGVLTTSEAATKVNLLINGLASVNAYADAMDYLRSLPVVKSVDVSQVNGDSVVFSLMVQGGQAALAQAVSLGHQLTPKVDAVLSPQEEADLRYQWMQ